MAIRYLKIAFAALISLMCLIYAAQNITNLNACYQAFAYVLGGADHTIYPDSIFPAIQSPILIWLALGVVVSLELIAGIFTAMGTWQMWRSRKASAVEFNGAKSTALLGCGIGIVVWMGLFGVFGGAAFQMWQTEIGGNSLGDAFHFFVACALVFIIVNHSDG